MTAREIIALVAAKFEITPTDLIDHQREPTRFKAYRVAIYLCQWALRLSYPALGREFRKDHTTMIAAVQAVGTQMSIYAEVIGDLREQIALRLASPRTRCVSCGQPVGEQARKVDLLKREIALMQKRLEQLEAMP